MGKKWVQGSSPGWQILLSKRGPYAAGIRVIPYHGRAAGDGRGDELGRRRKIPRACMMQKNYTIDGGAVNKINPPKKGNLTE